MGWAVAREACVAPVAAFRLQLNPAHMRWRDASGILRYLSTLGVTHLYLSPHLHSRAGSAHGYDIVDFDAINPELGTEEELAALHKELAERGMSVLVDWVPNHMAIGAANPLWMDVLENGPSSAYARFFDIDWTPVKTALAHKVLVPVLGDQYGLVLEAGELHLLYDRGTFSIGYYDHRFPVSALGYARILEHGLEALAATMGEGAVEFQELQSILTAIRNLPPQTETDQARLVERRREKDVIKRRLAVLADASAPVREHIDRSVHAFNGQPGDPASFALLDELLAMHGYRLAHWRVAGEEINYRRFFDINELVALRMEDPVVFTQTHRLLADWIARGWVRALRVDHPDGLFDPGDYFRRLQAHALEACCREALRRAWAHTPAGGPHNSQGLPVTPGGDWSPFDGAIAPRCLAEIDRRAGGRPGPLWIVVEKILGRRERMPGSWAVDGTTGYDFLNAVNGLFVDADGAAAIDAAYTRFTGRRRDFAETVYRSKKLIVETALASHLSMLAHRLEEIAESDYRTRDFTRGSLTAALEEVISCFPVYRTYIPHGEGEIDERDRRYVELAVDRASRKSPATNASVFDFIRNILLKRDPARSSPATIQARRDFLGKFQQLTAPALAKGMEDTAFYRYNRLVSLNEVGGEPDRLGTSIAEFHQQNTERLAKGAGSLLATSTHDAKRGEDVRLRIDVLSEMPGRWQDLLSRWGRANRAFKQRHAESLAPDRSDELLFYQTILGAWPGGQLAGEELAAFTTRIERYMIKAAREAKVHTSWTNPSAGYEEALVRFIRAILESQEVPFWATFTPFQQRVAWAGAQSSLSSIVLKVASPGVPDFYQGSELLDLGLVDPDNRAPVDFALRRVLLDDLVRRAGKGKDVVALVRDLCREPLDGRIKLFVTWRSLACRGRHATLVGAGDYVPLEIAGERARHVIALAREREGDAVIAVCGRFFARLLEEAGSTLLSAGDGTGTLATGSGTGDASAARGASADSAGGSGSSARNGGSSSGNGGRSAGNSGNFAGNGDSSAGSGDTDAGNSARSSGGPGASDGAPAGFAVGHAYWNGTRVVLPSSLARDAWQDAFTGLSIEAGVVDGRPCLDLGRLLEHLPVALLERQPCS